MAASEPNPPQGRRSVGEVRAPAGGEPPGIDTRPRAVCTDACAGAGGVRATAVRRLRGASPAPRAAAYSSHGPSAGAPGGVAACIVWRVVRAAGPAGVFPRGINGARSKIAAAQGASHPPRAIANGRVFGFTAALPPTTGAGVARPRTVGQLFPGVRAPKALGPVRARMGAAAPSASAWSRPCSSAAQEGDGAQGRSPTPRGARPFAGARAAGPLAGLAAGPRSASHCRARWSESYLFLASSMIRR